MKDNLIIETQARTMTVTAGESLPSQAGGRPSLEQGGGRVQEQLDIIDHRSLVRG